MYEPYEGSEDYEIIKGVKCYIPKKPFNYKIKGNGKPIDKQKWEREPLPSIPARDVDFMTSEGNELSPDSKISWRNARRQEIIKQTGCDPWDIGRNNEPKKVDGVVADPNYVNETMHAYRLQEFERCNPFRTDKKGKPINNGFWFMLKGKATYITPFHYFYLQWWRLDTGYATYRETDRKRFYFWQVVFETPKCYGMTEVSKRGDGKSFRAGSVLYQRTIFGINTDSAIQSKTEVDARKFFLRKVVGPYKYLPDFFHPMNTHGTSPTESMKFTEKANRSKNAAAFMDEHELVLNSYITYGSSGEFVYDGENIKGIFVRDEEGKTLETDVEARHDVTKNCVYRDGKMWGKIYSTTTVEESEKGGESFRPMWEGSDPAQLNELGQTKSGLYKLFFPAYETEIYDEFGFPVIDDPAPNEIVRDQMTGERIFRGARTEQAITRKQLANDPAALLRYCLKFPWKEEELFYNSAKDCPFNVMILETAELKAREVGLATYDEYRKQGYLTRPIYGNFVWKDGIPYKEAVFIPETKENAKWCVGHLFPIGSGLANNVFTETNNATGFAYHSPKNTDEFFGGFDPTKAGSRTVDKRRSKAGGAIFRKKQFFEDESLGVHGTFVADFIWEPDDPLMQYDHFLIGAWYYGAQILLENNIPTMLDRFGQIGCYDQYSPDEHFIMWRYAETFTSKDKNIDQSTPGMASNETTNEMLLQKSQTHIINDGHRLMLPRVIADFKAYRSATRTKHDLCVACQNAYMASLKPPKPKPQTFKASSIFREFA